MAELNLPAKSEPLAIETLITSRCRNLELNKARLVRLAGYKNEAKGIRRLNELLAGDFETTRTLIQGLPAALNLPPHVISEAVQQTRQQIAAMQRHAAEQAEAEWQAAFRPHAVILTERRIPSPMFLAAVIGVERLLRVDFDVNASPVLFVRLALGGVKQKLAEWGGTLPGYGRPTGIIVNYKPDFGARFDLAGRPRETCNGAYRVGPVDLLMKGRPIPAGILPRHSGAAGE